MGRTRERDNNRVKRKRNRRDTIKRRIGTRGGRDKGREVDYITREKKRIRNLEERGAKNIRDTTERAGMGVGEEERTRRRERLGRGERVVWEAEVEGTICEEN